MAMDRVILDPCGGSPGWGQQTCSLPPPAVNECRQEEIINSVVTGALSAIGTWILIGVTYRFLKGRIQSTSQYDPPVDQEKPTTSCSSTLLLILCGVAVGGATLCSWASTQLLNAILRSSTCFDFDEVLVAILAAMLAAS